jgi:hypothetical protein
MTRKTKIPKLIWSRGAAGRRPAGLHPIRGEEQRVAGHEQQHGTEDAEQYRDAVGGIVAGRRAGTQDRNGNAPSDGDDGGEGSEERQGAPDLGDYPGWDPGVGPRVHRYA